MPQPPTFPLQEVISFHADNSFYELNAERVEVSHDRVAHPFHASSQPVKVLTLVAYNAGVEPVTIQLDEPTALRLVAAIKAGFDG